MEPLRTALVYRFELLIQGITKGEVRNPNKEGCKRLSAFAHICLRFHFRACLRLSAFVCICLRFLASAYPRPCCAPLCVLRIGFFLTGKGGGTERGVRDMCVASDFVVSKSMLVAWSARHLLVTEKNVPPFRFPPPHLKVPDLIHLSFWVPSSEDAMGGWKKGFWTPPPRMVRFPSPSGVSAVFFLYKNPRRSRREALLEGSKSFRESAFSGTFSSPHTFCTPPYHGPTSFHNHDTDENMLWELFWESLL